MATSHGNAVKNYDDRRCGMRTEESSPSSSLMKQYRHRNCKMSKSNVTYKILYEDMSMVALEEIKDRKTQGADDG